MKQITKERQAQGWTRMELGFHAWIHPARVGLIESGRITPPDTSVELQRLAKALGWTDSPAGLLNEVDSDPVV